MDKTQGLKVTRRSILKTRVWQNLVNKKLSTL